MKTEDQFRLDGKVALVTGASRGIGRGIAVALARRGARVALNARGVEGLEKVAGQIAQEGGEALVAAGHSARAEDVRRLIDATLERFGEVDVLVNNAATNVAFGPLIEVSDEAVRKTFDTNVFGPLMLTREVVTRAMGQDGGSIVNISSVAALKARSGIGAYGASKAAMLQLTRGLARELGPRGIRVNAVAPSVIRTSFAAALHEDDEIRSSAEANAALGRIGEVDEVVGAVVYLASAASSYVTGQTLVVDGGTLA